jgi:hypothetical protein
MGALNMTQRVLNISNTQIISGTEIMTPGEGGAHTRLLWAYVPPFASRPDITVSIYSPEETFYQDRPECKEDPENPGTNLCGNAGSTFAPWAIEYHPLAGPDETDLIAIVSANTDPGEPSSAIFLCSYLAIGEARVPAPN